MSLTLEPDTSLDLFDIATQIQPNRLEARLGAKEFLASMRVL
jgi:hypothetical protein